MARERRCSQSEIPDERGASRISSLNRTYSSSLINFNRRDAQDGLGAGHFVECIGNVTVAFLDVFPDCAISLVVAHRPLGRNRSDPFEDRIAEPVERQRMKRAQLLPVGLSRNMSLARRR
jgi:hypothetical protein